MHFKARHAAFNFLRFLLDHFPMALCVLAQEPLLMELRQDNGRRSMFISSGLRFKHFFLKLVDALARVTRLLFFLLFLELEGLDLGFGSPSFSACF
ncbi:TPA: hypothetical protein EYO57_22315 [Candidatus Poribacteria bacterium]|nr:hypothetical protein [Candidatus Poribacteria bacterium]